MKDSRINNTVYVCSVCGETSGAYDGNTEDWLIAAVPGKSGEMVIRCPQHVTRYAIRKAGGHIRGGTIGVVGRWEYGTMPSAQKRAEMEALEYGEALEEVHSLMYLEACRC